MPRLPAQEQPGALRGDGRR